MTTPSAQPTDPDSGTRPQAGPPTETASLARPGVDANDLARARAELRRRLLPTAPTESPRIGRFTLLSRIGQGGMGVVYAVYDEQLDRRVALKVIRGDASPLLRSRLQREARAMAKLSHPNVVSVFEVGEHLGELYIAMEYVRGCTLREWARTKERAAPEVLDKYLQAGRGLAAAHGVGLVHRDFKADNAIVDDEGRVRVFDFGLVQERAADASPGEAPADGNAVDALTTAGSIMGTPAYMAPEQLLGEPTDHRADQFAYCVSLWEALCGRRPFEAATREALFALVTDPDRGPPPRDARIPAWLRPILERGLARTPTDRWPSLDALLAALAGDRRRRIRARAWAAGLSVIGLTTGGLGWRQVVHAERLAGCADQAGSLHETWNDDVEQHLRAAFSETGLAYADETFERAAPWVDAWATEWMAGREEACVRTVEASWSPELDRRAQACFEERRWSLEGLLAVFEQADATVVQRAVQAAAGLEDSATCLDADRLSRRPALPQGAGVRYEAAAIRRELEHLRSLQQTGAYARALEETTELRERAEALGWAPLLASVDLTIGSLADQAGDFGRAETSLHAGYFAALESGARGTALQAATRLTALIGDRLARPEEGRLWQRHAEALLAQGPPDELARASLWEATSAIDLAGGDPDEAASLVEAAMEVVVRTLGPDHPRAATLLDKLGAIESARESLTTSLEYREQALARIQSALGPRHPEVGRVLNNLAVVRGKMGEFDEARAVLEQALDIDLQIHGELHPSTGTTLLNLGNVAERQGDRESARAFFERAQAAFEHAHGPEHPLVARTLNALGNLHLDRGPEARALYERALRIVERSSGPDNPALIPYLANLAQCHRAAQEYEQAAALLRRVVALAEQTRGPNHPDVGRALRDLGDVQGARGLQAEAKVLYERAAAILDETIGAEHPEARRLRESNARQ